MTSSYKHLQQVNKTFFSNPVLRDTYLNTLHLFSIKDKYCFYCGLFVQQQRQTEIMLIFVASCNEIGCNQNVFCLIKRSNMPCSRYPSCLFRLQINMHQIFKLYGCINFQIFMSTFKNNYVNDNAKLTGQQRAFTCVCP